MRTIAIGIFLLLIAPSVAQEPKPPMLTPEEQKLAEEAVKLNADGAQLYQQGKPALAVEKWRRALSLREQLFPPAKYPGGHYDLALSYSNLGVGLEAIGQPEQALPFYRKGLETYQRLFPASHHPRGHPALAVALNNLGYVLQSMGRAEEALPSYRQGLEMNERLFPESEFPAGNPELCSSLNNMGFVLSAMGQLEQAIFYYQKSLEMAVKLYPSSKFPEGHADLAQSVSNLGTAFNAMGQFEQALPFLQKSLDLRRKLFPTSEFPDGHPELASGLGNLGTLYYLMGQFDQAIVFQRQSLEMKQKLYPISKFASGHPEIARSMTNLSSTLIALDQKELALTYSRQSLDMYQKLLPPSRFPNGHPSLVRSLNNVGLVYSSLDRVEDATAYYKQSREMVQKLFPESQYPDGHRELVVSLNNLGGAFLLNGQIENAVSSYRQAHQMAKKLYPKSKFPVGHPLLGICSVNLGAVLMASGRSNDALDVLRSGLEMHQQMLWSELATASEEAAFDKIGSHGTYVDGFLSATLGSSMTADVCCQTLWRSRSMVTRLLEQRQSAARIAGTEPGDKLNKLRGLRRRLDQLLQETRIQPEIRDKLLTSVANERDALERDLIATIPVMKHRAELDKVGPSDLIKALPPGAVFIDVIRYVRIEFVEWKQKRTPSYVAFVLSNEPSSGTAGASKIARVELGDAKNIDEAIRNWRASIERERDGRGDVGSAGNDGVRAVADIQRLVWNKLAPQLPKGAKTLYITADGDLARMPWAALPIQSTAGPDGSGQPVRTDRVLLEDYATAMVPHGLWLLDQLQRFKNPGSPTADNYVFVLGGLDYGSSTWPALPGTKTELSAIAAMATSERHIASGAMATQSKVTELMTKFRFIHLATHGEFRAASLSSDRQRAAKYVESGPQNADTRAIAAKNPLGYVGVVLSGGEVLSGLGIVDLPLTKTQLVTLSACETGLGELTGGEGVQGLQRAFHLAGCPNVVASLWKVSDAATAALMAKFYHDLWVNKKPPIEALREAQLMIYRHPERIPALAGERGKPDQAKTVELKIEPRASASADKRTPTKLWAAFVLSGVGK
jgi:CHAT domain-containing protein/tetratricopeptide (TPR) repeat protein